MSKTAYMAIQGMHCSNCPTKVEKAVSEMDGVENIDVSWAKETAYVTFDRKKVTVSDMADRIGEMGFQAKEIP